MNGKNVFISGATGSFGKCAARTILDRYDPQRLIIFSRDELKQSEMREAFPDSPDSPVRYFIGDIRDKDRLRFALQNVDIIIHAAALKQVDTAEYNPFEVIKTNVVGTQNLVDAAIEQRVEKIVGLSTDKAAAPTNLYGATKLCADKLLVAANNFTGPRTRLSVVRYGNVMGSRGSVIPKFLESRAQGIFSVTDKRMTRFTITLQQAVDFVLHAVGAMWGSEIFVPKIPSYRLTDVVTAIHPNPDLVVTGIRPGEKLHEAMITEIDAFNTITFDKHYVILPSAAPSWSLSQFCEESQPDIGVPVQDGFSYLSDTNPWFLSVDELKVLINQELGVNNDPL